MACVMWNICSTYSLATLGPGNPTIGRSLFAKNVDEIRLFVLIYQYYFGLLYPITSPLFGIWIIFDYF